MSPPARSTPYGSGSPEPYASSWETACGCSEKRRPTACNACLPRTTYACDTYGESMSRVHPAGPRHADVLPEDHPLPPPSDLNTLAAGVWPRGARRDDQAMTIAGADVRDLAAEYGT